MKIDESDKPRRENSQEKQIIPTEACINTSTNEKPDENFASIHV